MTVDKFLQNAMGLAIWVVLILGGILALTILGVLIFSILRGLWRSV